MSAVLKTSNEWLQEPQFKNIKVLDPDGWDRTNFEVSWSEKITLEEFEQRLWVSTCSFRAP